MRGQGGRVNLVYSPKEVSTGSRLAWDLLYAGYRINEIDTAARLNPDAQEGEPVILLVANDDVEVVTEGVDSILPHRFLPVLLEPGPQLNPRLARLHCLHLGRAAESARAWRSGLADILKSLPTVEVDLAEGASLVGTRWVSGLLEPGTMLWHPMVFELRSGGVLGYSNFYNWSQWTEPRRGVDEPYNTKRIHQEEPLNFESSWRCIEGSIFLSITSTIAPYIYLMFSGRSPPLAPRFKAIVGFWHNAVMAKSMPGALLHAPHTTIGDMLGDTHVLGTWIEEALEGGDFRGLKLPAADRQALQYYQVVIDRLGARNLGMAQNALVSRHASSVG